MGGVVEALDRLAVVALAHHPDEQVHPACGGIGHGLEHLVDAEWFLAQVAESYDVWRGTAGAHLTEGSEAPGNPLSALRERPSAPAVAVAASGNLGA